MNIFIFTFWASFVVKSSTGLVFLSNSSIDNFISSNRNEHNGDIDISMLAIVNYDGHFGPGPICTKAFEVALEQLKENGKLHGINLKLELENSQCNSEKMIKIVAKGLDENNSTNYSNRLPLMTLDECPSFANVAATKVLKANHYVGLSTGFKSSNLEFIKTMTTVGTKPEISLVNKAEMELMLKMGWKKYAVFSEDLSYFNEIEKEMFPKFDSAGLELVHLTKLNFHRPAEELEKMIDQSMFELKMSGANIIFFHSDYKILFACWLYKFELYHNKFIFASAWSLWNPETVNIPEMVSGWCTRDMLKAVVKAWSFESFGWISEVLGNDYIDDSGLTSGEFTEKMSNKIFEPYKSGSWKTWSAGCYDLAYFSGLIVDNMEKSLRNSSSSLQDWAVGGENFQQNPSFIQDLMLEMIYKVDFKGQMTVVDIDEKTNRNSNGWSPVIFRQTFQNDDGNFQSETVAYYRCSDSSFFNLNGGFRWATRDGKPPRDQIQIVHRKVAPTSPQSYIVFSIFSISIIATAVVLFFEFPCRKSRYEECNIPKSNRILLFALVLLAAHTFAIPFTIGQNMVLSCSFSFACSVLGFSLCLNSMIALNNTILPEVEEKNKWNSSVYIFAPILHLILVAFLLDKHCFQINSTLVFSEFSDDGRKRYDYYRDYCSVPLESSSALANLLAIASLFIILFLLMVFSAYTGRLKHKAKRATFAVKLSATCSYLMATVLVAFILIAIIKSPFEYITMLTPIASYIVAILTIGFVELPRFIKPDIYADQMRSRKNTLVSRRFVLLKTTVKKV